MKVTDKDRISTTSSPKENMDYFIEHHNSLYDNTIDGNRVYVGESDRPWAYFDVADKEGLFKLLKKLPSEYYNYALIEDWMVDIIDPECRRVREMICKRLYLPKDVDMTYEDGLVTPLKVEDADEIQNTHAYGEFTDVDYVKVQIKSGHHGCIRIEGKLVAWAITHDDGAIGFLYVLPEYRGKNYGYEVTAYIISKLRNDNLPVYVHIESDNIHSIELSKKLGFIEDRNVRWFTIEG